MNPIQTFIDGGYEYQCGICLTFFDERLDAVRCCRTAVSTDVLPKSCYAPPKPPKKAKAEMPVASLQGKRDR
jgi:hypothetical protein